MNPHTQAAEKPVNKDPGHRCHACGSDISALVERAKEEGAHECSRAMAEDEKAQGLVVIRRDLPKHPENFMREVEIQIAPPTGHILDDAGAVRKVLETAEFLDGVTWGLKPGQSMLILESPAAKDHPNAK